MTFAKTINHARTHKNEQEFQTKLAELMGEISTLPATERQKPRAPGRRNPSSAMNACARP